MAGFSDAWVLLFLLSLPVLYLLYAAVVKKKKRQAMKFSHVSFVKSALGDKKLSKKQHVLFYLSLLVVALMILGFAHPHIPLKKTHEGVNVVLVLDVSGSMQATDYQPTRLEAAKVSAEILLDSLEENDHVGIVTFQTGATTAAYLSPFKERVIEKLRAIKPKDGKTAIGDGLSLGLDMALSIPNKKKVVILLSDGVSNAGVISPAEAVAYAQVNDIQVHTIGMGSEEKVVLGHDWFGNPQYAQLDEETLIAIAKQTGGQYYKTVDEETLGEVYTTISDELEREREEVDVSEWCFALALVVFLVTLYMRYGGRRVLQ